MMAKEEDKNFEISIKCWICDDIYVERDVKVRNHCPITGKSRGSSHRNCNNKVKLNHKIPIVFHNLNNFNSHLIMQKLGEFGFKIKVTVTLI